VVMLLSVQVMGAGSIQTEGSLFISRGNREKEEEEEALVKERGLEGGEGEGLFRG